MAPTYALWPPELCVSLMYSLIYEKYSRLHTHSIYACLINILVLTHKHSVRKKNRQHSGQTEDGRKKKMFQRKCSQTKKKHGWEGWEETKDFQEATLVWEWFLGSYEGGLPKVPYFLNLCQLPSHEIYISFASNSDKGVNSLSTLSFKIDNVNLYHTSDTCSLVYIKF